MEKRWNIFWVCTVLELGVVCIKMVVNVVLFNDVDHLSITVSAELRTKILAGKFVDITDLVQKNFKVTVDKVSHIQDDHGHLIRKIRSVLSIDQWTTTSHTYMSIYLEAHPDCFQGMLSYTELIRGAARDHPLSAAWRRYDEEFRSKMESDATRPWGMTIDIIDILTLWA